MANMLEPEEVAAMFKRSVSWLYKNYKLLSATKGFPRPVRLNGYNLQWSSKDVDIWFDMHINSISLNDNRVGGSYEKLLAANAALL